VVKRQGICVGVTGKWRRCQGPFVKAALLACHRTSSEDAVDALRFSAACERFGRFTSLGGLRERAFEWAVGTHWTFHWKGRAAAVPSRDAVRGGDRGAAGRMGSRFMGGHPWDRGDSGVVRTVAISGRLSPRGAWRMETGDTSPSTLLRPNISEASIRQSEHVVIEPRMANVDWRRVWAESLKVLNVGRKRNASLPPVACGHVAGSP